MMSNNDFNQDNEETIFHDFKNINGDALEPDMFFVVQGDDVRKYPIKDGGLLTVGRNANQDVVLQDVMVSREHIVIRRTGFRVSIEIKGQNGLKMDGKLYMRETIDNISHLFQIGKTVCRIESDATVLMKDDIASVDETSSTFSPAQPLLDKKERLQKKDMDSNYPPGKSERCAHSFLNADSDKIHDDHFDSFENGFGPEIVDHRAIVKPELSFFCDAKTAWAIAGGVVAVLLVVGAIWSLWHPWETPLQYRNEMRVGLPAPGAFQSDGGENMYAGYVINRAKEYVMSNEWDKAREILKTVSPDNPDAILLLKEINRRSGE